MKEWREVFGTEAEQPEEFDTTASPTTVYQRRNIKKATKEDADGKKITGWQREEREMSREEYDRLTRHAGRLLHPTQQESLNP